MPPKPPTPPGDDEQRKATAGRTERATFPGIPSRFVPPRPVSDEVTPPEPAVVMRREREAGRLVPPVARTRVREQTLVGMGPATSTPPPRAPVATAPPRSISPSPESASPVVTLPDGSRLRKHTLKRLWLFVAPVVITLATSALGYLRGYAKGLADAAERLTKIEARASTLMSREATIEVRLDTVEGAEAAEEASNRAERATALRRLADFAADLEQVKQGLPKIQGLATKKPTP